MRKQKLNRKSLDELAEIMPVLNDDEQRMLIGGTYYYTPDGYFLGTLGLGSEIRITDAATYKKEFNSGNVTKLHSISTEFDSSGYDAKWGIVNEIGSGMGIPIVRLYSGPTNQGALWSQANGFRINTNSPSFTSGNYHEIYLILLHEKKHSEYTPAQYGVNRSELKAYEAVLEHSYFQDTTSRFRSTILSEYQKYKKLVEEEDSK